METIKYKLNVKGKIYEVTRMIDWDCGSLDYQTYLVECEGEQIYRSPNTPDIDFLRWLEKKLRG